MIVLFILYIVSFIVMAFVIRYMKKVDMLDDLLIALFKFLSFMPILNTLLAIVSIVLVICFSLADSNMNPFQKISKFLWGD